MIKVSSPAQIVKAKVASVKNNVAELNDVILQLSAFQAEYSGSRFDCLPLSSPTLVIPVLNVDVRDTSLNLPYSVMQDIRRMQNAHISR